MARSILCDFSDANMLVNGIIIVVGAGVYAAARAADRDNKLN